MSSFSHFDGSNIQSGFGVQGLFKILNNATISAKTKLQAIQNRRSAISIGDMFEMQMLMNHLSQVSDMSSNIVSAANTAIGSMTRNIKS